LYWPLFCEYCIGHCQKESSNKRSADTTSLQRQLEEFQNIAAERLQKMQTLQAQLRQYTHFLASKKDRLPGDDDGD
jgi:hypothetical protein